jgi:hypothetical protein
LVALVLTGGCGPDDRIVRLGEANVMYAGEPYGDFLVLADAVRECMNSDETGLPHLTLVDRQVECRTVDGWQWVLGCAGEREVVLVAPTVTSSEGQLWAHELTHYFGDEDEGNPCGALYLEGFSLQPADAD